MTNNCCPLFLRDFFQLLAPYMGRTQNYSKISKFQKLANFCKSTKFYSIDIVEYNEDSLLFAHTTSVVTVPS